MIGKEKDGEAGTYRDRKLSESSSRAASESNLLDEKTEQIEGEGDTEKIENAERSETTEKTSKPEKTEKEKAAKVRRKHSADNVAEPRPRKKSLSKDKIKEHEHKQKRKRSKPVDQATEPESSFVNPSVIKSAKKRRHYPWEVQFSEVQIGVRRAQTVGTPSPFL